MAGSYWIGFDLGGTKMMATVFNGRFKKITSVRRKTKAYQGANAGVKRIAETIQRTMDDAGCTKSELKGIGIGIPGLLDLERGIILDAPNLGWTSVRIRTSLQRSFGCPVVISNDVDAGVYAEYHSGSAKGARCVLGVFPGTGIGGGCIYKGEIVRGERLSSMEIGHIQVMSDGPLCGCGQRGCLEAVAGRLAVSAAAAQAAFRGTAPHLLEIAGTDLSKIKSGALAASIDAGDRAIETIVREAAQWIGVGIAGVINLMAPDVVLLGGGLVEAMPDMFREAVETSARARVMSAYSSIFKVTVATLGDDATVTGAAAWARECIAKNKVEK